MNATDKSTVRVFFQISVEARLALAAVSALERVGYTRFGGTKKCSEDEFVVFCASQQYFAIFVERFLAIRTQHLATCCQCNY